MLPPSYKMCCYPVMIDQTVDGIPDCGYIQTSLTSHEQEPVMPRRWQVQEAKARFSELVERAMAGDAQVVTRRGRPAVVVIPYEEYERMHGGETTGWDLFKAAPRLDEHDLPLTREATPVHPAEFE
jgi:prevent-host-death family protein